MRGSQAPRRSLRTHTSWHSYYCMNQRYPLVQLDRWLWQCVTSKTNHSRHCNPHFGSLDVLSLWETIRHALAMLKQSHGGLMRTGAEACSSTAPTHVLLHSMVLSASCGAGVPFSISGGVCRSTDVWTRAPWLITITEQISQWTIRKKNGADQPITFDHFVLCIWHDLCSGELLRWCSGDLVQISDAETTKWKDFPPKEQWFKPTYGTRLFSYTNNSLLKKKKKFCIFCMWKYVGQRNT